MAGSSYSEIPHHLLLEIQAVLDPIQADDFGDNNNNNNNGEGQWLTLNDPCFEAGKLTEECARNKTKFGIT